MLRCDAVLALARCAGTGLAPQRTHTAVALLWLLRIALTPDSPPAPCRCLCLCLLQLMPCACRSTAASASACPPT